MTIVFRGLLGLGALGAGFGALLALVGAQTAEAVLPTQAERTQTVLAALSGATLPPLEVERSIALKRGQTLSAALNEAGFTRAQVQALVKANAATAQPVSAKTTVTLTYKEGAPYQIQAAELAFRPTPVQEVQLALQGNVANGKAIAKPLTEHRAVAVGRITDSLWADASRAGLSPHQIKEFMDIFAWDLDYTRDIQPGDTFKVTYEETRNDLGQSVKTGRILAAAFTVDGETRQAFWWGNNKEYLNEKGESKRKLLLRTPRGVKATPAGE